ncbi:hypothetical protein [Motiliproteus sp.]|uniref:hypothetical protein n=1 Tax=Motiliproteus sp. TaxID=1898955 RepID=UPI003BAB402B
MSKTVLHATTLTSLLAASALITASGNSLAQEVTQLSGSFELELRSFFDNPLDPRQHNNSLSMAATPEFYHSWNDDKDALTITPFIRIDQHDAERSHADLREFNWLHVGDNWQLRTGVGKVFWGSTESQHLVDIVNQTDGLEGVDGEDKLGQPMLHYSYLLDAGDISFFWLPYFRERTFAGVEGRPRTALPVDTDRAQYESGAEQWHQDFALRWSYSFDSLDLALSHFHGTSREPTLLPDTGNPATATSLIPRYEIIDQTSLDLTSALGDWLWKLEAIHNSGLDAGDYNAAVGGFEYTYVGWLDSDADLGLLMEYHYDSRGQRSTRPFQDDIFAGLRITLNDFQSTEFLAGLVYDRDSYARMGFIEASRRLGSQFKLSVEARLFDNLSSTDPLYGLREDSFVQLTLEYFFSEQL